MILRDRKFRWHRGSYAESMATETAVRSFAELQTLCGEPVAVQPYGGIDPRNGWDTHIVIGASGVVGFTDGYF